MTNTFQPTRTIYGFADNDRDLEVHQPELDFIEKDDDGDDGDQGGGQAEVAATNEAAIVSVEPNSTPFGVKILEIRSFGNLSRRKLAAVLNMSQPILANWEHRAVPPTGPLARQDAIDAIEEMHSSLSGDPHPGVRGVNEVAEANLDDPNPEIDFGLRMKELRRALNLKRQDFAARVGVSMPTLSLWETRSGQAPKTENGILAAQMYAAYLEGNLEGAIAIKESDGAATYGAALDLAMRVKGWNANDLSKEIHYKPNYVRAILRGDHLPTTHVNERLELVFLQSFLRPNDPEAHAEVVERAAQLAELAVTTQSQRRHGDRARRELNGLSTHWFASKAEREASEDGHGNYVPWEGGVFGPNESDMTDRVAILAQDIVELLSCEHPAPVMLRFDDAYSADDLGKAITVLIESKSKLEADGSFVGFKKLVMGSGDTIEVDRKDFLDDTQDEWVQVRSIRHGRFDAREQQLASPPDGYGWNEGAQYLRDQHAAKVKRDAELLQMAAKIKGAVM